MKKNNYCLMLSEGVVNAIDAEAARRGTNRSALINRILAEYVSYVTPEMRAREILLGALNALDTAFRREGESENAIVLSSALAYRYRPTVRYSFELYRAGESFGEIRLAMRAKNPLLLEIFERFCLHFSAVEQKYTGRCDYKLGEGRFARILRIRENDSVVGMMTLDALGALVAGYISMLDRALKLYFGYADDPPAALVGIDHLYRSYLSSAPVLL